MYTVPYFLLEVVDGLDAEPLGPLDFGRAPEEELVLQGAPISRNKLPVFATFGQATIQEGPMTQSYGKKLGELAKEKTKSGHHHPNSPYDPRPNTSVTML